VPNFIYDTNKTSQNILMLMTNNEWFLINLLFKSIGSNRCGELC